ncbi:unnamed protein product, partial [Ectocarpus sp. 8 AP-2014]
MMGGGIDFSTPAAVGTRPQAGAGAGARLVERGRRRTAFLTGWGKGSCRRLTPEARLSAGGVLPV